METSWLRPVRLQHALGKEGQGAADLNAHTDLGGVLAAHGGGGGRGRAHQLGDLVLKQDAADLKAGGIGIGQVIGDDIQISSGAGLTQLTAVNIERNI